MTGIRWNPPEWDRNPLEWTGIRRNSCIPAGTEPDSAGIGLDSTGMEYFK